MGLGDILNLISSMFIMLEENKFILFRIEFLVVLVTILFLAMFIMDIFRRHIHSPTMKALFSLFDAVSDSIVIYLLGAMQTAPFKNQLFPVWALVLIVFRYSIDFISGYGVPDNGGRRFTEWSNVLKLLLVSAFLNTTRGSRFARPLWSFWALQMVRSGYRFYSHTLASNSNLHGLSSEIVSEHMCETEDPSSSKWKHCNPETMEGYRYLLCGESVCLKKPRYVLHVSATSVLEEKEHIDTTPTNQRRRNICPCGRARGEASASSSSKPRRSPLITLDKIWGSLSKWEDNNQKNKLKDLSLAFALSRLLRCRLEDLVLPKSINSINRKLVSKNIIEQGDAKRAFRVMELQLSFINDYFNTRHPMVFWSGLRSLCFSLLLSVMTFAVVLWLSVDINKVYKPPPW